MSDTNSTKKLYTKGLWWCFIAYAIALGGAALSLYWMPADWHLLLKTAVADIVATLIIFLFSRIFNNSSFYDAYWSVIPIAIGVYWFSLMPDTASYVRPALVLLLVNAWGIRLTYSWARGWKGLQHEDWRYVDLRHKTGKAYWLVSLTGLHLFPTVMTYLSSLSLYPVLLEPSSALNPLDMAAFVVTAGAIIIETIADKQLHDFKKTNTDPQKILDTGLWRNSRHPNYFGEMTFWWGLFLFGLAANPNCWWTIIGPLVITGLFFFISVNLIDTRMLEKRPHYAERIKKVSAIIPWFTKA